MGRRKGKGRTYRRGYTRAVSFGDAGRLVLSASFNAGSRDGAGISGGRGGRGNRDGDMSRELDRDGNVSRELDRDRDMSRDLDVTGKLDWVTLDLAVGGFGARLRWSNGGGDRGEQKDRLLDAWVLLSTLHQIDISHPIDEILFEQTCQPKDHEADCVKLTSATRGAAKATSAPRAATRIGAAEGSFILMQLIEYKYLLE